MVELTSLQLFKTFPMKLGWASYCCLEKWESCACAISVRRWISLSQDLPSSGNAPGKWIITGSQTGQVGSLPLISAYSVMGCSGN